MFPHSDGKKILANIGDACQQAIRMRLVGVKNLGVTGSELMSVSMPVWPVESGLTRRFIERDENGDEYVDNSSAKAMTDARIQAALQKAGVSIALLLFRDEINEYVAENSTKGGVIGALRERPGPKITPQKFQERVQYRCGISLNSQEAITLVRECAIQGETDILINAFLSGLESILHDDPPPEAVQRMQAMYQHSQGR